MGAGIGSQTNHACIRLYLLDIHLHMCIFVFRSLLLAPLRPSSELGHTGREDEREDIMRVGASPISSTRRVFVRLL